MITIQGGQDSEVKKQRRLTGTRKSSALTLQILLCRSQSLFSPPRPRGFWFSLLCYAACMLTGLFWIWRSVPRERVRALFVFVLKPRGERPRTFDCVRASISARLDGVVREEAGARPFPAVTFFIDVSLAEVCLSGAGWARTASPPTHSEKDEMPQSLYDGLTAPVGLSAFGPCAKVWNKRFCFCFWAFIQMSIDFSASLAPTNTTLSWKNRAGSIQLIHGFFFFCLFYPPLPFSFPLPHTYMHACWPVADYNSLRFAFAQTRKPSQRDHFYKKKRELPEQKKKKKEFIVSFNPSLLESTRDNVVLLKRPGEVV